MAISYASKISCPKGFRKAIEKSEQIMLIANRRHIKLKNEMLVLTQPPLKVYGITRERLITFVYSSVDKVNDDVLTAYIGIGAVPVVLERIVMHIDQCFFTELNLPLGKEMLERDGDQLRNNLLNPKYKNLFMNIMLYNVYFSDNPILLDEDECARYTCGWSALKFKREKHDLEPIIKTIILQLGEKKPKCELSRAQFWRKKYDSKQKRKRTVKRVLGVSHSEPLMQISQCR